VAVNSRASRKPGQAGRVGDFHNVYVNPEAYHHYLKTGKFPDKTVLVMAYTGRGQGTQNLVLATFFGSATCRRSCREKQQATGWIEDGLGLLCFKPWKGCDAKAFKDATCYECHKKHADDDNVWCSFIRFCAISRRPRISELAGPYRLSTA